MSSDQIIEYPFRFGTQEKDLRVLRLEGLWKVTLKSHIYPWMGKRLAATHAVTAIVA